jgi:hypothetical protein
MKFLFYAIFWFSIFNSCSEVDRKYSCGFSPSSPTDLKIKNNTSSKVELKLLVNEQDYECIAEFDLKPNEVKQICIENEGKITEGLYFDFNGNKTKVILKSQRLNKFNLANRFFEYE